MRIDCGKARVSVTFPFIAVITLMLLLYEENIVLVSVFSSLIHELGHLFFMLFFSVSPSLVSFGAFGIRIERNDNLLSYRKEALISLGGIFANSLLCIIGLFFYGFYNSAFGVQLFAVNAFIAAFNMLPVRILDCGRCLECICGALLSAEKGELALNIASALTTAVIALACVLYNIFVNFNISFIAVCVYIIFITNLKE